MAYRFGVVGLEEQAGSLRLAGDSMDEVRGRVLTLLSYVGRYSGLTAALATVVREVDARAADLAQRAGYLESLNPLFLDVPSADRALLATAASYVAPLVGVSTDAALAQIQQQLDIAHGLSASSERYELLAALAVVEAKLLWDVAQTPIDVADPAAADSAARTIVGALDESWFGDVSRGELLTIHDTLATLDRPTFDAVIARLSDDELYRWFHELDGVRGGNLNETEEAELFAMLTLTGSAATSWRLAQAERGTRLHYITTAITHHPDPAVRLDYLALAATDPANTDHALAALSVLDSLDPAWQTIAADHLGPDTLDKLADTLNVHVAALNPTRDQPIPIEFLQGVWDGTTGMVTGIAGLTIQGLWDRDAFRENWSALGGAVTILFKHPGQFFSALIDLERLRTNPTHWAGALVPEIAAAVFTGGTLNTAAKTGKLGATLQHLTTKLDNLKTAALGRLSPRSQDHFDIALGGGHHSGFLNNYFDRPNVEIARGIRSLERRIDEHIQWIDNPTLKIPEFDDLDIRQQRALIEQKWPSDIARQSAQLAILRRLLELKVRDVGP